MEAYLTRLLRPTRTLTPNKKVPRWWAFCLFWRNN